MDAGLLKGLIAIVTMTTFLGICWWAYRPGNRERFEEDAMLAFGEDEPQAAAKRSSASPADRDHDNTKTEIEA